MQIYLYNTKSKKGKKSKQIKKPRKGQYVWINCSSTEDFKKIIDPFEVHPLTVDDCTKRNTRIKTEVFDKYILIIAHGTVKEKSTIKKLEMDFILGENFLITNYTKKNKIVTQLLKDQKNIDNILKRGPVFLMRYFFDRLLESYFPVIEEIDAEIDKVEEKIFKKAEKASLQKLFKSKQRLLDIRRTTTSHREVISELVKHSSPFIPDKARAYLRDTQDKSIRIADMIEMQREVVANIVDTHTTLVSNKMNQIMKMLTIMATIMMPLTVIGSIYGMNFKYMPELYWKWSYPIVLSVMLAIALGMLYYFKRKEWI